MGRAVYELQGFAITLDKVALVSRVFTADNNEGYQFNINFSNELRLPVKFPNFLIHPPIPDQPAECESSE